MKATHWKVIALTATAIVAACSAEQVVNPSGATAAASKTTAGKGGFGFNPLTASAVCTNGGSATSPFVLPEGFDQAVVASEPSFQDAIDMNTQNENGPQAGRYLYRVSEVGSNGSLSVTDLETGETKIIAQRSDWEALDPTVWTPWGTLLFAEETGNAGRRDPAVPQAVGGLVYEVTFDQTDLTKVVNVVARPAIGAKSHEGMRFDKWGNLYSISERTPGYIFKFVPDNAGDLSSGQTYVMRLTSTDGDRTGLAEWVALDRTAVQIDASAAADAVGATGYGRPEDLEIATSPNRGGANDVLFAAITSENRVLAIDLHVPGEGASSSDVVRVRNYVARGLNVNDEFLAPDNLALDAAGSLFITEDPGGNTASGKRGDDIWVATHGSGTNSLPTVGRFATLTDCEAEPTGIYFDIKGDRLFVNVQHRGGDRLDKTMAITPRR